MVRKAARRKAKSGKCKAESSNGKPSVSERPEKAAKSHIHNCFVLVNEQIARMNAAIDLDSGIAIDWATKRGRVETNFLIPLKKIDATKKKPLPKLVASYCPFCGEKLEHGLSESDKKQ